MELLHSLPHLAKYNAFDIRPKEETEKVGYQLVYKKIKAVGDKTLNQIKTSIKQLKRN